MSQTIMIVDNDQTLLSLAHALLRRQGYTVLSANDAFHALKMLAYRTPDLFVIDTSLPEVSGYQLCRVLRARSDTSHTPILFMSTWFDCEELQRAQLSGMNDYLQIANSPSQILDRVQHLLVK